jgi:hypothetical protein
MQAETNFSPPGQTAAPYSKELRALVHAISVSLLILTGTVFVFIYREVVLVRRQTAELARYLIEYERSNALEFIENVRQKLGEFRKDHPDFNPIYSRYFGTNEPASRVERLGTTNPAAAPATP